MSVTAASLLSPTGEIEISFFPGENETQVTARLNAYITEGVAKAAALSGAAQDAPVTSWAYHRAYKAIYTKLLRNPSSWAVEGEGSASISSAQIREFGKLADDKLAEFNGAVVVPIDANAPPMASSSTSNVFTW